MLRSLFARWLLVVSLATLAPAFAGTGGRSLAPQTIAKCLEALGPAARWEMRPIGPRIFMPAAHVGTRPIHTIRDLQIAQYNVENFFDSRGKWVWHAEYQKFIKEIPSDAKPLADQLKLRAVIEGSDADILVLEEVEDAYAAQDFVDQHLGGRYRVFTVHGNDSRGIDIVILVKLDLPLDVEVLSHREALVPGTATKRWSRDFLLARFYVPGASKTSAPLFGIGGFHLKSQRPSASGPTSAPRREQEARDITVLMASEQRLFPHTPYALLGDANADLRSAPELRVFSDAGFMDSHDAVANPLPVDQRITHSYHPRGEVANYSQLDATLVNPIAVREGLVKETRIVPYLWPDGTPRPYARTYEERADQGSDHWMVQMTLNFQKTYAHWQANLASDRPNAIPLIPPLSP